MNKREDKKEKEKTRFTTSEKVPKPEKNGWEAEVPKTEKTFLQISLVNFFLKIFRSMNIL